MKLLAKFGAPKFDKTSKQSDWLDAASSGEYLENMLIPQFVHYKKPSKSSNRFIVPYHRFCRRAELILLTLFFHDKRLQGSRFENEIRQTLRNMYDNRNGLAACDDYNQMEKAIFALAIRGGNLCPSCLRFHWLSSKNHKTECSVFKKKITVERAKDMLITKSSCPICYENIG